MQESAQVAFGLTSPFRRKGDGSWSGGGIPPMLTHRPPSFGRGWSSDPQHEGDWTVIDQSNLHMGTEAAGCNPRMRGACEFHQPVEPAAAFFRRGGRGEAGPH